MRRPLAIPSDPKVPARRGRRYPYWEFFAGSGLVGLALSPFFEAAWANDVCPKKAAVFRANRGDDPLEIGPLEEVRGALLPPAVLSWASFPCQDLSLAGNGEGIRARRSGMVWEWLRVMDEAQTRPAILVAENVGGLVSLRGGENYKALHRDLAKRGYRVGAMELDAFLWLPQSRPRIFVVAVDETLGVPRRLLGERPDWAHSAAVRKAAAGLKNAVWWRLPVPEKRAGGLSSLVDFSLPCQDDASSEANLALVPQAHKERLGECGLPVVPGYRRARGGKQVLELRFDDAAGCLRTPSGGSSRQFLLIKRDGTWKTRLLSPREAARLMGAPESFRLPGSFNDGYRAMGDAVAAPVTGYLARHLLSPLAEALEAPPRPEGR